MRRFYNTGFFSIIFIALFILGCATSKVAKVSPYVGEWHYTYQNMDGTDAAAIMTITEAENVYTGVLSSQMGSVDLQDLVITDGKLTAKFDIQGYVMSMKGGFEGDTYTGSVIIDGNEFPMIATRKAAEK
jgi:hypothetical protein